MNLVIELNKRDIAYNLAIEHRLSIYKNNTNYILMNVKREIDHEHYGVFRDRCLNHVIRIGATSTGRYLEPVAILEEERGIIPNSILNRYPDCGVILKDSIRFPNVDTPYTTYSPGNEVERLTNLCEESIELCKRINSEFDRVSATKEELKNKLEAKELLLKIRDGQMEGHKRYIGELNDDIRRLKSSISTTNEQMRRKDITIRKLGETIDSNNKVIAELKEDIAFRDDIISNVISNIFG